MHQNIYWSANFFLDLRYVLYYVSTALKILRFSRLFTACIIPELHYAAHAREKAFLKTTLVSINCIDCIHLGAE